MSNSSLIWRVESFLKKFGKARHLNTESHAPEPGTWRTADSTEPGTWVSAQHQSHLKWQQMANFLVSMENSF